MLREKTVTNIEHTGDCIINVVDDDRAEAMNLSLGDYTPDVSGCELTGLTLVPGTKMQAPRNEGTLSPTTKQQNPPVKHPFVNVPPRTGQKELNVAPSTAISIVGMGDTTGR